MSQHPGTPDPERRPATSPSQDATNGVAGDNERHPNATRRITPLDGPAGELGTPDAPSTSGTASPAPAPSATSAAPARGTASRPNSSRVTDTTMREHHGEITATAGLPKIQADGPSGAHRWGIPRFLVVTLGLAATIIILLFVKELQDIIAPIFLGLNLMIVAYPIQRWLSKIIHRYLASIVALMVVLAVLVAFVWACVWSLVELVNLLPQYNAQFQALWTTVNDVLREVGFDSAAINKTVGDIKPNDVMGLLVPVLSNVSSIASLLTTLVIATFFLAMDSASMNARLKLLRVVQPRALVVVSDFSVGVRRYWLVTTVFGAVVALADVAALAMIGVPLVWVWGVLSFITNYIPNIGFVIGVIPPALVALLSGGPVQALVVVIVYCALNFVIQVLIQPKFTGESVGVTPVVSFFSLLFWVFILGPLGALLALPATLLLKAFLIDSDPDARWLNLFIASSPDSALPDEEQPEPRNPRKRRKVRERQSLLRG